MLIHTKPTRTLKRINSITGRNIISYYSGWLKKPDAPHVEIDDVDKNAFMNAIHGLDRSTGLDIILHTPGGDIAATESLVQYLKSMFKVISELLYHRSLCQLER